MKNIEYKTRKKVYKKALKKKCKPFKGLSVLTGILAGVMIPTSVVINMFDNTIVAFAGGSFWELQNPDNNAQ